MAPLRSGAGDGGVRRRLPGAYWRAAASLLLSSSPSMAAAVATSSPPALRGPAAAVAASALELEAPPPPKLDLQTLRCRLREAFDAGKLEAQVHAVGQQGPRPLPKLHGTCAVVSSSGVLRSHHWGKAIDAAEAVFRFNTAPTSGYERLVGSKDTLRVVNELFPGTALQKGKQLVRNGTIYVVSAPHDGRKHDVEKLHRRFPSLGLFSVATSVPERVGKTLRGAYPASWFSKGLADWPTTGALGMLLAMSLCGEVKAYGMAATSHSLAAPMHYYGNNLGATTLDTVHRSLRAEKDLWKRLATNSPQDIDSTDVVVIPGFAHDDGACSKAHPS